VVCAGKMGTLVTLHVYDVTNSGSGAANNAIITLNRLLKDTWNVGGVFHCGVEVNREEWAFGFCEQGTGVRVLDCVALPAAHLNRIVPQYSRLCARPSKCTKSKIGVG
jgi:hypothetical protein